MWPRLARRQEHLVEKRTRLVALKESAMESLQRGRSHESSNLTGEAHPVLIRTIDGTYQDFRWSKCAISPNARRITDYEKCSLHPHRFWVEALALEQLCAKWADYRPVLFLIVITRGLLSPRGICFSAAASSAIPRHPLFNACFPAHDASSGTQPQSRVVSRSNLVYFAFRHACYKRYCLARLSLWAVIAVTAQPAN